MTEPPPRGLCDTCRHVRLVRSRRDSAYVLCERSRSDPRFPRYPRLPVRECPGFEEAPSPAGGRGGPAPLRGPGPVLATWWPLAASWLMMGLELPLVSAVMARLADPEISLAAYGGVIFPLALLIEAPIIMLLAASTALSRDRDAYSKLRRFMLAAGASLTALHVALAATPLWHVVVGPLLDVPEPVRAPARLGFLIMTPWTFSIAYRRFQQGVLIRFGHSRRVGVGTAVRLGTIGAVLAAGALLAPDWPGIAVGTSAIAAAVIAEAVFVGIAVRPVLRRELPDTDPGATPLDRRRFLDFYVPLALTSLLTLLAMPLGSAAMGRMPRPVDSLAVWPVLTGLVFLLRSLGFAYNEVVVALLDRPGAFGPLARFATVAGLVTSGALAAIAAGPLAVAWFGGVSGLAPDLTALGAAALWIVVPMPAFSFAQSFFTGVLVNRRRTRGISQAVAVYLATSAVVLGAGVLHGEGTGLYFALSATVIGHLAQLAWLVHCARAPIRELRADAVSAPAGTLAAERSAS